MINSGVVLYGNPDVAGVSAALDRRGFHYTAAFALVHGYQLSLFNVKLAVIDNFPFVETATAQ